MKVPEPYDSPQNASLWPLGARGEHMYDAGAYEVLRALIQDRRRHPIRWFLTGGASGLERILAFVENELHQRELKMAALLEGTKVENHTAWEGLSEADREFLRRAAEDL